MSNKAKLYLLRAPFTRFSLVGHHLIEIATEWATWLATGLVPRGWKHFVLQSKGFSVGDPWGSPWVQHFIVLLLLLHDESKNLILSNWITLLSVKLTCWYFQERITEHWQLQYFSMLSSATSLAQTVRNSWWTQHFTLTLLQLICKKTIQLKNKRLKILC